MKERLTQLEKIIVAQQRDIEQLLAGRFPVKISTENGEIKVGDFLTSSPKPGIVMKALEPGRVIGIALEPFNGEGVEKLWFLSILTGHCVPSPKTVYSRKKEV